MATDAAPGYPTKEIREKCWSQRDIYWKCLDENKDDPDKCKSIRQVFESSCPDVWIKHYDRRRKYLKFKAQIEREDFDPVDYFAKESEEKDKANKEKDKK